MILERSLKVFQLQQITIYKTKNLLIMQQTFKIL